MSKPKLDWANADDASSDEGEQHMGPDEESEPVVQEKSNDRPSYAQPHRSSAPPARRHDNFIAYVANLPYSTTENELGNFFHQGGCQVQAVNIHKDNDGRSKGYAHVEFKNRESLTKALTATGQRIGDREIRVDESDGRGSSRPSDRGGNKRRDDRGGMGGGRGGDRGHDRGGRHGDGNDRGGRYGDRDRRGGNDGRGNNRNDRDRPRKEDNRQQAEAPPAERKVLHLQPRTLPIDSIGQKTTAPSSIFGDGRARDEFEEAKKHAHAPPAAATTTVAATPAAGSATAHVTTVVAPPAEPVKTEGTTQEPQEPTKDVAANTEAVATKPNKPRGEKKPRKEGAGSGKSDKPRNKDDKGNKDKKKKEGGGGKGKKDAPKSEEEIQAAKFQEAQNKINKREAFLKGQEQKQNAQRETNAFGALTLESEDENTEDEGEEENENNES